MLTKSLGNRRYSKWGALRYRSYGNSCGLKIKNKNKILTIEWKGSVIRGKSKHTFYTKFLFEKISLQGQNNCWGACINLTILCLLIDCCKITAFVWKVDKKKLNFTDTILPSFLFFYSIWYINPYPQTPPSPPPPKKNKNNKQTSKKQMFSSHL